MFPVGDGFQCRRFRQDIHLPRFALRTPSVEELAFRATERGKFREAIKSVQDLERLVARAALGTAGPRDLVGLKQSLAVIPRLRTVLAELQAPLIGSLVASLDDLADVRQLIESTLIDEPPVLAREGGFTRDGVDAELGEFHRLLRAAANSVNHHPAVGLRPPRRFHDLADPLVVQQP